ncbi:hypothetical protein ACIHFE_09860 [Streptomyces sp. NPDC052396]|uniref:hypothetical protein n=1 Tax=Streptomyces sp. NPDC052396 TaxID=3365689 RepID=UPI0037CE4FEA
MSIKRVRTAVVTAAAIAGLILGSATSASADGRVTWRHRPSGNCLYFNVDIKGTPNGVDVDSCEARNVWNEEHNSDDDTWLMHPADGYCLAAFSNLSVYVEPCTPNNDWQRWYERWTGSSWKLQHKQTGLYLDSNGEKVYLGPGGWNNDNKYQLWY